MAVLEKEVSVHFSKYNKTNNNNNNNNDLQGSFINCRLNNHYLSAQRVEMKDGNSHYDKRGIADRYIFMIRCHECNLEWKELWRASIWFIMNSKNDYVTKANQEALTVSSIM
jgi:hypothetical protein